MAKEKNARHTSVFKIPKSVKHFENIKSLHDLKWSQNHILKTILYFLLFNIVLLFLYFFTYWKKAFISYSIIKCFLCTFMR